MAPHTQPASRDHFVRQPAPWVGGCSDRGLRHAGNEDALAIAVRTRPPAAVLAVADGVSTARGSDVASTVAAEAVVAELVARGPSSADPALMLEEAFAVANQAVLDAGEEPSACTLIAATVEAGSIAVGSVGDSRAYWLGDDGQAHQLSTDDSLAQARMLLGMTRDEAERSSQAHAITKWLGRRSTDATPTVTRFAPTSPGWLLLCSDGLWNYASSPEDMAILLHAHSAVADGPGALAESLVGWACGQGGKDNITVVVARWMPDLGQAG